MIKKIKGLKKFTDCSMPSNEAERISKAEVAAYNKAIDDVVKLCNLHIVNNNEVAVCACCGETKKLTHCEDCAEDTGWNCI